MKFRYDHDLHIHTHLSLCSNEPTQTYVNLLKYAEETGLNKICITDHFWDETVDGASDWYKIQNYKHISQDLPLPESTEVNMFFGCETDLNKYYTLGISSDTFDKFDFVIIPTTHLHMRGFTISESDADSLESRADLWCKRLEYVLGLDIPFHKVGIAHLSCHLIAKDRNYLKVLQMIPDEKMRSLFSKVAKVGVGIELNYSDMNFDDKDSDIILRPFRIAKECGCKFYCGSDTHRFPNGAEFRRIFERAIDLLGLEESDKIDFLRN